MRLFPIIVFLLFCLGGGVLAQSNYPPYDFLEWIRGYAVYSNEWAVDVLPMADGNCLVLGVYTAENGDTASFVRKLDAAGNIIGMVPIVWPNADAVMHSLCPTSDGGFGVAGHISDAGGCHMYVEKYQANLSNIWFREYPISGAEEANALQQTADGGFIVTGWSTQGGNGKQIVLMKLGPENFPYPAWTNLYGGPFNDYGYAVRQATDGGYIIAGRYEGTGAQAEPDQYLLKTDAGGVQQWSRSFHNAFATTSWEDLRAVFETADHGYVAFGSYFTFVTDCLMSSDIARKVLSTGVDCWAVNYESCDRIWNASKAPDGGFVMSGETWGRNPTDRGWALVRWLDPCKKSSWSRAFGGNDRDVAMSTRGIANEIYICAGYTEFVDLHRQSFVAKFLPQNGYICGDVNDNGTINLLDISYLINYLYKGGPAPAHPGAADVNCDGVINLLDNSYLINYLYHAGPAPCTACQ